MLARYTVILAVDRQWGIAKDGQLPWNCPADMRFFRDTTSKRYAAEQCNGDAVSKETAPMNVVIMGRKTWESIPEQNRPLKNRINIVLSTTMHQSAHPQLLIRDSFAAALKDATTLDSFNKGGRVFCIGGAQLYNEALSRWLYLCERVLVTRFDDDYSCDTFVKPPLDLELMPKALLSPTLQYKRWSYEPVVPHQEWVYLDLLKRIRYEGAACPDRTGTGTVALYGEQLKFDISQEFPLLTTKAVEFSHIVNEVLWLLTGNTNTRLLEEKGVKYWRSNTSRAFLDKRNLSWKEGSQGAAYGHQARHCGAEFIGDQGSEDEDGNPVSYAGLGIDQWQLLLDGIRDDPHSRRHMINFWNVWDLDKMALPPCVYNLQFHVSTQQVVSLTVSQRSFDSFLGGPYNIAMYALVLYIVCHLTHSKPGMLTFQIGDAHLYSTHIAQAEKQMSRTPFPWPRLEIVGAEGVDSVEGFQESMFRLVGYESWPALRAKIAV